MNTWSHMLNSPNSSHDSGLLAGHIPLDDNLGTSEPVKGLTKHREKKVMFLCS